MELNQMAVAKPSFLSRFGSILLDGIEAGAALELQREFLPSDDRVFTYTPGGNAAPRGQPVAMQSSLGGPDAGLLLLAVGAFFVFKAMA